MRGLLPLWAHCRWRWSARVHCCSSGLLPSHRISHKAEFWILRKLNFSTFPFMDWTFGGTSMNSLPCPEFSRFSPTGFYIYAHAPFSVGLYALWAQVQASVCLGATCRKDASMNCFCCFLKNPLAPCVGVLLVSHLGHGSASPLCSHHMVFR